MILNSKLKFNIEIDRVIMYTLISKMWSFIAGPITALIIANKFNSNIQGYYYTFATLLSLQVFVELGLGTVTQQFISHEWVNLEFDKTKKIHGESDSLSRFYSISKISIKWFFLGAMFVSIGLAIGGFYYFSNTDIYNVNWKYPWFTLCFLSFFTLQLVPFWSILEGCNQLNKLYSFRMIQSVILNVTTWVTIYLNLNLWVTAIVILILILSSFVFIKLNYWNFFKQIINAKPTGPVINWKKDMFPMHWRIALSWISGYLSFSLFTPILFKYQGAEIAGKFGLSWSIISAITGIGSAWLSTKIPTFGMLISKRNYNELNKTFKNVFFNVLFISFFISLLFILFILISPMFQISILNKTISRLLSPLPLSIFLFAQVLQVSSTPFSAYLRAHKREPGVILSIISGILISSFTYYFAKNYTITHVAAAYFFIILILFPFLIIIWKNFKINNKNFI